jgi:hypothetical protein
MGLGRLERGGGKEVKMEVFREFFGLEGHILALQLFVFAPLGFVLGGLAFRGLLGALAGALLLAAGAGPALALVLLGGWGNLAAEATAIVRAGAPGNAIAFLGGLGLLVIQEALRVKGRSFR